jgi:hypothetical protein
MVIETIRKATDFVSGEEINAMHEQACDRLRSFQRDEK